MFVRKKVWENVNFKLRCRESDFQEAIDFIRENGLYEKFREKTDPFNRRLQLFARLQTLDPKMGTTLDGITDNLQDYLNMSPEQEEAAKKLLEEMKKEAGIK